MLEIAQGLVGRGHKLELLYKSGGPFLPIYREAGCRTTQVPLYALDRDRPVASAVQVARTVARGVRAKPDVYYVNDYQHAPSGAAVSVIRRVPLVCHLRLLPPPSYSHQLRATLPRVSRFMAVSKHVRSKFASSGIPDEKIEVVYTGVDLDRYAPGVPDERRAERAKLGIADDELMVLFAGRLDHVKGVDVLISAFKKVVHEHPGARLVIVGGALWHADEDAGRRYIDQLKRSTDSRWATWLEPRPDIVPLYRAADVVVVPSLWDEPFSRVVIEAMACGTAVVGSSSGGAPEALTGELAPLVFESGDSDALVRVLLWLRSRAEPMGVECRKHAERRFGLSRMIDQIEAVLLQPRVD